MKKLIQLMFVDDEATGFLMLMEMLRLSISDLVLVCALQTILGLALIACLEIPWSLLGYAFVLASAYTLKTIPAIKEALEDGGATSK